MVYATTRHNGFVCVLVIFCTLFLTFPGQSLYLFFFSSVPPCRKKEIKRFAYIKLPQNNSIPQNTVDYLSLCYEDGEQVFLPKTDIPRNIKESGN